MTSELRPAVEVWWKATDAWKEGLSPEDATQAAAAVIEADREAVRAEQAAELTKFKALAETLAGAGNKVADAAYHGEECPMNTTGAYCNCGYDEAYDGWSKALRQYKEARDER